MKMKFSHIFKYHRNELVALVLFFAGGTLGMLGLIQRVPLVAGILGVVILALILIFGMIGKPAILTSFGATRSSI